MFQSANAISYLLLSGNIITLYALHLGASSLFIGIMSSFQYVSYLFMVAGRELVPRMGVRNLMATGWLIRSFFMAPLLFAPLLYHGGNRSIGLTLILFGLLFFHLTRGVAVAGFNPIVGAMSEGRDRGEFLSRLQIFDQTGAVIGGILIIAILGEQAPIGRYTLFIAIGIVLGVVAALLFFRIPKPPENAAPIRANLASGVRTAMRRRSFRRFIALFFVLCIVIGMSDPFRAVYAKLVYQRTDQMVIFYTVVGNVGAILMGLLSRLLMDRLGAKPLYVFFTVSLAASVIPLALAPALSGLWLTVFMSAVFFVFQIGLVGSQNGAQNYFFAIISPAEFLDLGILYNLCLGIGGAVGSAVGGALIDLLGVAGLADQAWVFRLYFSFVLVVLVAIVFLVSRLTAVGRYTVRSALGIIFSPRDIRAAALLQRLERKRSVDEEVEVIRALADSHSEMAIENLLEELRSPRFYVRSEALRALESHSVTQRVVRALVGEVRNHPFTTAYIAARIIGQKRITQGVRVLRSSIDSKDYLLQANAMLALGRLRDASSIPRIERALERSANPLVLIHGITALEELASLDSVPLLLRLLKQRNPPAYLRDEIILSMSGIVGVGEWFYAHYIRFIESVKAGQESLIEYLDENLPNGALLDREEVRGVIDGIEGSKEEFARAAARLLVRLATSMYVPLFGAPSSDSGGAAGSGRAARQIGRAFTIETLADAVYDPALNRFDRFCFFVASVIVYTVCAAPEANE